MNQLICKNFEEFRAYEGKPLPTGEWLTVTQEMIDAFIKGNNQKATAIQVKFFPLFQALFMTTNPIPVKAALNLQGWDVGKLRTPLCELQLDLLEKLKIVLKELELL